MWKYVFTFWGWKVKEIFTSQYWSNRHRVRPETGDVHVLFCTFAKVEFFDTHSWFRVLKVGMSQQNESVGVRGGSIPVILSSGTSIISRQRSFARLDLEGLSCSALTSRRFSRGSWQRSSARSRWNRSWPWCGRWPCPPPSRGCPLPLGGSLGWLSSAAPPLRMGSAGRKPKAAR